MSFNEVIDQIKQYPISDLIGNYIAVKKVGSGHEAMCPFHGDSNPSLKISDSKKLYKCFACGASGDHISFVQNFKSIEFIDAIKEIAGQFNISTDSLDQNKNKDPKLEMAQRVLTSANKLYKKYAQTSHKKDYDEFIKNRGLTEELALDFNIGFAPKGNVFLEYLQTIPGKDKEFAMQVAQDIGIIKKGQNGLYDAFRSRITFPIKDQLGHVRGFSCRATYEGQIPKYLNSHESMVFHKRNILYGLDIAKSYIRQKESVIIVEGNMDAVALHQYGFNQTVALMGTAMSEFGITRLKTITKNFFLCLDNDNAGHKAMERINVELLNNDIMAKFIDLGEHKDPDDFLKAEGRLAFIEVMENAPTFLDYKIGEIIPKEIPENPDKRHSILVDQIFPIIAPLKSGLQATERVINAATRLGFKSDANLITQNYESFLKSQKKPAPKMNKPKAQNQPQNQPQNQQVMPDEQPASMFEEEMPTEQITPVLTNIFITKSEKILIRELLNHPEAFDQLTQYRILAIVPNNEVKRVIQWLSKLYYEVDDSEFINVLQKSLPTSGFCHEIIEALNAELFNSNMFKKNPVELKEEVLEKLLKDLSVKLEIDQLKLKKTELKNLQKECSSQVEIMKYVSEINEIDIKIIGIKTKQPRAKL